MEWIKRTNATVGCDGDSFVKDYLRNVLHIQNIKNIGNEHDYPAEFKSGNITAAFLELPYKKVFLNEYCNEYAEVGPSYRFGGQGFVFQKGSPIAHDVSIAILTLAENGKLKGLEEEWFGSSQNCSNTDAAKDIESLSFESFWALYLMSGITTTISFLIFIIHFLTRSAENHDASQDVTVAASDTSLWNKAAAKMFGIVQFLNNTRRRSLRRSPTFANTEGEWRSSQWDLVNVPSRSSETIESSPQQETELTTIS